MNQSSKKPPQAQMRGAQAGKPLQHQAGITQPKLAMSSQMKKPPVAPPVYRPQPTPKAAQPKMANGAQNRKPPVAPPAYRPQPVPKVLQTKLAVSHQSVNHSRQAPANPPGYNPRPVPKVLQANTHRPQPLPKVLQQKQAESTTTSPGRKLSFRPPAYQANSSQPRVCARPVHQNAASRSAIQRTVHIFTGGSWTIHTAGSSDVDAYPLAAAALAHPPEEGDTYDEQTGIHNRRAEKARQRLARAEARQVKRTKPKKRGHDIAKQDFSDISNKKKNRLEFRTPGGTMRLGRGMYNTQPYGTLAPEDWGKAPKLGINYDEISKALDASGEGEVLLDETLAFMSSVDPVTPSEASKKRKRRDSMAQTAISGLLTVAEPHALRNPLGGKPERAAVRRAKRKKSAKEVFNRKDGAYVPAHATAGGAKQGGTSAWRQIRKGKKPFPLKTLEMIEKDMSDSSAEES